MNARELFPVGALVMLLVICRAASAIDVVIEKEPPPQERERHGINALDEIVLERLYSSYGDAKGMREQLAKNLARQIHIASERYALKRSQTEKLVLSGRGDIHQFIQHLSLIHI